MNQLFQNFGIIILRSKKVWDCLIPRIIDMHFVVRSRYNRLFTAIAKYPTLPCIGIDEGTAIIVHGNTVKVAGASQVMVFSNPQHLQVTNNGYIKFDDIKMSVYTEGDSFQIRQ